MHAIAAQQFPQTLIVSKSNLVTAKMTEILFLVCYSESMHITTIFSTQFDSWSQDGQNWTGWPRIIDSHHTGICDVTIQ